MDTRLSAIEHPERFKFNRGGQENPANSIAAAAAAASACCSCC